VSVGGLLHSEGRQTNPLHPTGSDELFYVDFLVREGQEPCSPNSGLSDKDLIEVQQGVETLSLRPGNSGALRVQ